jgi:hypothetical protein
MLGGSLLGYIVNKPYSMSWPTRPRPNHFHDLAVAKYRGICIEIYGVASSDCLYLFDREKANPFNPTNQRPVFPRGPHPTAFFVVYFTHSAGPTHEKHNVHMKTH